LPAWGKLVVIKFNGDLHERGFLVNLELGLEGKLPYAGASGALPAAPSLISTLEQWQQQYRCLGLTNRIKPQEIIYGGTIDAVEKLLQLSYKLGEELKNWLESDSFRAIDKLLREELNRHESIRILLRAEDRRLHKLPWHLWDFLERYPQAELAFGTSSFKQVNSPKKVTSQPKVRILAVIGDSQDIDTEADLKLLQALPDTEVALLVEPNRQELNYLLWEKPWDLLFFAGHSQTERSKGRIYLNAEDSLTIEELKYGLNQAIAQGLQIAIFNSCDGLGLANQLEQLQLPQIIVMREPIPDRVAQEFLKNFLGAFASGDSLYFATRIAREKLQGWENRFPCASWLPIIYQNPATIPPSWQNLRGETEGSEGAGETRRGRERVAQFSWLEMRRKLRQLLSRWQWSSLLGIFLVCLLVSNVLLGVRSLGVLQNWESIAFDRLMQWRQSEPPDRRILVVTIDEADIAYQQKMGMSMQGSLADEALTQLLQIILPYQPRAIGVDIYHDRPFSPSLANLIARTPQLIGVCQAHNPVSDSISIKPASNLAITQVGFSDFPYDPDNVIRRQFLGMTPDQFCQTDRSFSLQLALAYLQEYPRQMTSEGLKIGDVLLKKLTTNAGGYQLPETETQGYQILINYRSSPPATIPLREILSYLNNQQIEQMVRDRVVLVGIDLPNQDRHDTPFSHNRLSLRLPGVLVHAHQVSQIISAVIDKRKLLHWLPEWLESGWILLWSFVAGTIFYCGNLIYNRWQKCIYLLTTVATASISLHLCCYLILCQGIWIPSVPAILAFALTAVAIAYNPLTINIKKKIPKINKI
jgi:CHASE2 domain-containing sensor protein